MLKTTKKGHLIFQGGKKVDREGRRREGRQGEVREGGYLSLDFAFQQKPRHIFRKGIFLLVTEASCLHLQLIVTNCVSELRFPVLSLHAIDIKTNTQVRRRDFYNHWGEKKKRTLAKHVLHYPNIHENKLFLLYFTIFQV